MTLLSEKGNEMKFTAHNSLTNSIHFHSLSGISNLTYIQEIWHLGPDLIEEFESEFKLT